MSNKEWTFIGEPVDPADLVLKVKNYLTPHIFKSDGRWVAVNSILYTKYSKVFVPIAEAETLEELKEKLKPSLFRCIKKWIRRIL